MSTADIFVIIIQIPVHLKFEAFYILVDIWVNFRNKLKINSIFNYIKKEKIFIKHSPIFRNYLIRHWWLIYKLAVIEMSLLISFVRMLKRFCLWSSNQISKSHVPQIKFAYHVLKKGYLIDSWVNLFVGKRTRGSYKGGLLSVIRVMLGKYLLWNGINSI